MTNEFTAEEVKAARDQVRFDGEPVRLGRNIYIVPSLSIKKAKELWPTIMKLDAEGMKISEIPEKQETCVEIIHAALKRNYPNMSRDELDEMVDMSNIRRLMLIVSAASGFKEMQPGEQQPAVERPVVH